MPEFAQRQRQARNSYLVSAAKPDRAVPRPTNAENPVLAQQQPLGNQATQWFAESCPLGLPSPSLCPYGGACHTCPAPVQAKLTINRPGDKYEQEADRVAEQVMRMPEPRVQRACPTCDEERTVQTKPLAAQITPLVQRQVEPEEEEEEEAVQTKLTESVMQRQEEEPEDEEESMQTKLAEGIQIQRQEEEPEDDDDGEMPIQTKPLADQIMPLIQRQVEPENDEEEEPIQPKLAEAVQGQRQELEKEEESIQTKQAGRQASPVGLSLTARIRSLRNSGQPLPRSTRHFFEPWFAQDFSQVRIHTDGPAAETTRMVNARAFTIGHDVVFGTGQYAPDTATGRNLLAHELTHVVQQRDASAARGIRGEYRRGQTGIGRAQDFFIQRKPCPAGRCPRWRSGRANRIVTEAKKRLTAANGLINEAYAYNTRWVFCPNPYYRPRTPFPPAWSKNQLLAKVPEWQKRQNQDRRAKQNLRLWKKMSKRLGTGLRQFPPGEYVTWWGYQIHKCHLFVFDVLYKAGLPGKDLVGRNGRYFSARNLWKISHLGNYLKCVPAGRNVKKGDIYTTGPHTEIVAVAPSGKTHWTFTSIGYDPSSARKGLRVNPGRSKSGKKFFRVIR